MTFPAESGQGDRLADEVKRVLTLDLPPKDTSR